MKIVSKSNDSKRVEIILDGKTFHAHHVSGNEYSIRVGGTDAKPIFKNINIPHGGE